MQRAFDGSMSCDVTKKGQENVENEANPEGADQVKRQESPPKSNE